MACMHVCMLKDLLLGYKIALKFLSNDNNLCTSYHFSNSREERRKSAMSRSNLHMWKHKGADELCGYHATDQRLCFHYIDSTTPLLPESEISDL